MTDERSISSDFAVSKEREAELCLANMDVLRDRGARRAALYATAVATAGRVQALAAEVGFERIAEDDIAAAWRTSAAGQATSRKIVREHPSKGMPRTFARSGWDIASLTADDHEHLVEVGEVKWERGRQKLAEVLWDTIKIATALASTDEQYAYLEHGLLIVGAPTFHSSTPGVDDVLTSGHWVDGHIISDRPEAWNNASGTTPPPSTVPAGIELQHLASVPVQASTRASEPWELRVLDVRVIDPTFIPTPT